MYPPNFPQTSIPGQSPPLWEFIDKKTASASATIDIAWTKDYELINFKIHAMRPATASVVFLEILTSSDGGSTFDTGASDYDWSVTEQGSSISHQSNSTDVSIQATYNLASLGITNTTNSTTSMNCYILRPFDTGNFTTMWGNGYLLGAATTIKMNYMTGRRREAAKVDAIRFAIDTGNIAEGDFEFWGLLKA